MQNPKFNTFIIPVILLSNIEICLKTIYKYNEKNSFYVYLIDMSVKGLDANDLRDRYENLMVIRTPKSDYHYTGNLGFAQATNLGISLVQTPYFTMLNDDVELINKKWWQGIMDTFEDVEKSTPDAPAVMVCAASIRLADWSVNSDKDYDIIPYKTDYSEEDWDFLVNESHYINEQLTIQPGSVFDGVTMYACVCDTKRFLEIGLLPEQHFPGSGEDYWYSCKARMMRYRSIATTKSWVFHHWSSTFRALREEKEEVKALQMPELNWNNNHEDWGNKFDIWGIKCTKCNEILRIEKTTSIIAVCPNHPEETCQVPEAKTMPL